MPDRDILMLAHVHYPDEVRVRREIDALVGAGYQVDLVCLCAPGQQRREEQEGVRVIRLPLSKTRHSVLTYLWEYSSFCFCAFWLTTFLYLQRRYRLIQVYNQPDFLVFAALVPRVFGARIVFDYRDPMPEGTMDKFELAARHPVVRALRLVERAAMRFSHRILTVHQPLRELLVRRGFDASSIAVYMNLPDPKLFNRTRYRVRARDSAHGLRLMHHGTLNEIYNVGLILEALALIRQEHAGVQVSLTIYGTGPDLPRLKALADQLDLQNVCFGGRVPLDAVPGLIASEADGGVVPTRGGPIGDLSLSNKLLEYVVMGKPVIASRLPTFQRVFGEASLLFFDDGSAEGLAACILSLARDPTLRDRLVRSADADLGGLSWKSNQRQYVDWVSETMGDGPR